MPSSLNAETTKLSDSEPANAMMGAAELQRLALHATEAEALLKAMANRSRLMILCTLHEGEFSVSELNARIPLSQSALSQHLATLRRARLVDSRRDAQNIYYRLSESVASAVIAVLHAHYCGARPVGRAPST